MRETRDLLRRRQYLITGMREDSRPVPPPSSVVDYIEVSA
jgi:hypothetical protein